jgi:hypothetical protein
MPKSKKKRTAGRAEEQAPNPKAKKINWKEKRPAFIIGAVVIIFMLIIFGISYYPTYIAPLRITVISVDDINIRMDYFLKRCEASSTDPMYMLTNLTQEEIIKLEAPLYGIEISPEEIDQALRTIAAGTSGDITESEFKEWYRQRLNETGLSNSEYREITATSIMSSYLYIYVAERTSTIVEQVHLHTILLDTEEEAIDVLLRLEAGESFADLARELSLDGISRENGGDLGWIPRGVVYESRFDSVIFDLEIGTISEPQAYYDSSVEDPASPALVNYYLFLVSEKSDTMEVDEEYLPTLMDDAFNDWLAEKMSKYDISYRGFNNGFDSETYAWINWQLSKREEE